MSRRKKPQGDVELNLAAMLDMAFQLLAFFILTFKPAPIEGQISLKLPPPEAITATQRGQPPGTIQIADPPEFDSLLVTVLAGPTGGIGSLIIGERHVANLNQLDSDLGFLFQDEGNPFDQVVIQVGPTLKYEGLMSVIDVCTRLPLPNGQKLSKLSFVELPEDFIIQ